MAETTRTLFSVDVFLWHASRKQKHTSQPPNLLLHVITRSSNRKENRITSQPNPLNKQPKHNRHNNIVIRPRQHSLHETRPASAHESLEKRQNPAPRHQNPNRRSRFRERSA
jgi:hypothetical protein